MVARHTSSQRAKNTFESHLDALAWDCLIAVAAGLAHHRSTRLIAVDHPGSGLLPLCGDAASSALGNTPNTVTDDFAHT